MQNEPNFSECQKNATCCCNTATCKQHQVFHMARRAAPHRDETNTRLSIVY